MPVLPGDLEPVPTPKPQTASLPEIEDPRALLVDDKGNRYGRALFFVNPKTQQRSLWKYDEPLDADPPMRQEGGFFSDWAVGRIAKETGKGFIRGTLSSGSLITGAAPEGLGLEGVSDTLEAAAGEYRAAVPAASEIEGVSDFFEWSAGVLAEQGPVIGLIAAGAIGGGWLAAGAGLVRAAVGAAIGGGSVNLALQTGETKQGLEAAGIDPTFWNTAPAAVLKAGLDMLPLMAAAKRLGFPPGAVSKIVTNAGTKSGAIRWAQDVGGFVAAEGATEGAQEWIDQVNEQIIKEASIRFPNRPEIIDILNAAAAGGLAGGVLGAAVHLRPRPPEDDPDDAAVEIEPEAPMGLPPPSTPGVAPPPPGAGPGGAGPQPGSGGGPQQPPPGAGPQPGPDEGGAGPQAGPPPPEDEPKAGPKEEPGVGPEEEPRQAPPPPPPGGQQQKQQQAPPPPPPGAGPQAGPKEAPKEESKEEPKTEAGAKPSQEPYVSPDASPEPTPAYARSVFQELTDFILQRPGKGSAPSTLDLIARMLDAGAINGDILTRLKDRVGQTDLQTLRMEKDKSPLVWLPRSVAEGTSKLVRGLNKTSLAQQHSNALQERLVPMKVKPEAKPILSYNGLAYYRRSDLTPAWPTSGSTQDAYEAQKRAFQKFFKNATGRTYSIDEKVTSKLPKLFRERMADERMEVDREGFFGAKPVKASLYGQSSAPKDVRDLAYNSPNGLVVEEGFPQELILEIARLKNKFLPNTTLVLTARPSSNPNAAGQAGYLGGQTFFLRLDPKGVAKVKGDPLHIALHEFGHVVFWHHYASAPSAVKEALNHAYHQWLTKALKWNSREFKTLYGGPLETRHLGAYPGGVPEYLKKGGNPQYMFSYSEWAAQQFAMWQGRNYVLRKGEAVLVRNYFKQAYDKLLAFWNDIKQKLRPDETFEDYMEYILETTSIRKVHDAIDPHATEPNTDYGTWQTVDDWGPLTDLAMGPVEMLYDWRTPETLKEDMGKFGKFQELTYTLLQLGERYKNIKPLQDYIKLIQQQWREKIRITQVGEDIINKWHKLGKEQSEALSRFVYDVAMKSLEQKSRLTGLELKALKDAAGLNDDGFKVWREMDDSFKLILAELKTHDIAQTVAQWGKDPEALAHRLARIEREYKNLGKYNYFPLTRFGQFAVMIRATKNMRWQGKDYKPGQVVAFETYENKREGAERAEALKRQIGDLGKVSTPYLKENQFAFMGFPPTMIDGLKEKLNLTPSQEAELKDWAYNMSPGQSFKKHLLRRRGVAGFSLDAQRAYARYMMQAAGHVSRMKYWKDISTALGAVQKSKITYLRGQLAEYLDRHYEYVNNPGNEWSQLRAWGFLWYLGLNAKSALVNLTQIPMIGYPYLSSRYGDVQSTAALAKAMKDSALYYKSGKGLSIDEARALEENRDIINESLASELAAHTEGGNLNRMYARVKAERAMRKFNEISVWMFQTAEQVNRNVMFLASYRLAKAAGEADPGAAARKATQTSMFEYARWNRPQIMRGKKSALFLFMSFVQHMVAFIGQDQGRWRALLMLGMVAGIQGLPGADDLLDLINAGGNLFRRLTGSGAPYLDVRKELRELLDEIGANPDLVMHGAARYSFGLSAMGVPSTDLTGSLSMGRIVPGIQPLSRAVSQGTAEVNKILGETTADVGGPIPAIGIGMLQAMASDNPDVWKKVEKTLPVAAQNLSKGFRWMAQGEERNNAGVVMIEFDPESTAEQAEIWAQMAGFKPTRLSQKQELEFARRSAAEYYNTRQSLLYTQYYHARQSGDREAVADVVKAVRRYNDDVPFASLKISSSDLSRSYKSRTVNRRKAEAGLPRQRQYRGLYEEYEQAFPQ